MFLALTIYKSSECCFIRVSRKLWCPRSLGALFLCAYFLLNQEIVLCQEQMELKPQKIWVPSAAQNPQILCEFPEFPNITKYTVSPSFKPHLPGSSYSHGQEGSPHLRIFLQRKGSTDWKTGVGAHMTLVSVVFIFKMLYKVREIKQKERENSAKQHVLWLSPSSNPTNKILHQS